MPRKKKKRRRKRKRKKKKKKNQTAFWQGHLRTTFGPFTNFGFIKLGSSFVAWAQWCIANP